MELKQGQITVEHPGATWARNAENIHNETLSMLIVPDVILKFDLLQHRLRNLAALGKRAVDRPGRIDDHSIRPDFVTYGGIKDVALKPL